MTTLPAYNSGMVFVELTPFIAFREMYWTDDELIGLQRYLLVSPDAGDLISGGAGIRKIRWQVQGRGKRGGARVIYYWQTAESRIYLIYGYVKSRSENLTKDQIAALSKLTKELQHG